MNDKIKELALQAGVDAGQTIANIICGDDEFKALGNEFNKLSQETRKCICKVIEQNQEKFAELIVKECIDCALWVGNINSAQTDPIRTAHAIKHRILNKLLKVEE